VAVDAPERAWAQYSSGGYSRAGGGFTSSYSAPSRRAPVSSSGGYSRRPYSGGGYTTGSFGDRAVSRSLSAQAFRDYQAAQRPTETYTRRAPAYAGGYDWTQEALRRPSIGEGQQPVYGAVRRSVLPGSGPLTAVALWAALNSLSTPSSAQYFHNYQYDPGYMQWRQEADREAGHNPAVAAKLNQLDAQLAQMEGQPRSQSGGGPVRPSPAPGGSGFIWPVLFIGIVILLLLWLWRRRMAQPVVAAAAAGLAGSAATRFRVGMTMPVDPSPFLLAAGLTKVQPPEGSGMISVEVVGLLREGGVLLHRLYLPGGKAFFQLHLGPDGQPDECRYFSRLDEVTPADRQEWGLWLDPSEGMIGWTSFQTKDGKMYGRVWAPGNSRVPPRQMEETLQYVDHAEQRQLQMMLYGGPTGGAPPAPQTEYILVSAIEATGQAWVEIDAGIDINPAGLTLPTVPLAA
jgi:MYXO-CTERM domain-containing protein